MPTEVTPETERKTVAEIVTARVQASVRGPVEELERRLRAANETIDRLLAFVPSRAAAVDDSRLHAIGDRLLEELEIAIPEASRPSLMVLPELDPNSTAVHRMVLSFDVPESTDPVALAHAAGHLYARLVRETSQEELDALRLLVEPDVASGSLGA